MRIYTYFYGDAKFLTLVKRLSDQLQAVAGVRPIVLVPEQDVETYVTQMPGNVLNPFISIPLGPASEFIVRPQAAQFDTKARLLMEFMTHGRRDVPSLMLDADNLIRRNPLAEPEMMQLGNQTFAMPEDGGMRNNINHPLFEGPQLELTSSCLHLPANCGEIAFEFQTCWQMSTEKHHVLLEQRTWSLVYHFMGVKLSRRWAWSRFWGEEPADTIIRHPHGAEKWNSELTDAKRSVGRKFHPCLYPSPKPLP